MKLILALTILLLCEACSVSQVMKDCAAVQDETHRSVCKTLKPWE